MGRSKESFGKKEVRKRKKKKRRLDKKEQGKKGSLDDMVAWGDENGMITLTPPGFNPKVRD